MLKNLKWATGALVVSLVSFAFGQSDEGVLVDLNLKDADIVAAARALTMKTGLKFVFEPSTTPFNKVTLKLDQVTPDQAMRYICAAAGAAYRKDDGVYLIGRQGASGQTNPSSPLNNTASAPAKKSDNVLRRIAMLHVDPYDTVRFLTGLPPDMSHGLAMGQNMVQRYALGNGSGSFGTEANPTPAGARPVSTSVQAPLTKTPTDSVGDVQLPGESSNQLAGMGGGGQFGGGGGGIGGFGGGQFGGGGGGIGGFGGGQGGIGGGLNGQTGRGGLIPPTIDFMTYDPNTNTIWVRGPKDAVDQLQQYIDMFDQAPKQVLIKLEFITTSSSYSKSLGYDFNYQRGPILFGAPEGYFTNSSDPYFLSYAWGNITARLRTNLTNSNGKVVSAPIIRTLNNQSARLRSSVQTYIVTTNTITTSQGTNTFSTPLEVDYTTEIDVTPRINDDGTITMYLQPTITDQGQIRELPTGSGGTVQVPDRLQEQVQVVVRVQNGQTIVLGGLTRRSDQGTEKKFPILGDLPFIGQFFKGNTSQRNYSELLIFVTPTVVEEDNNGLEPL